MSDQVTPVSLEGEIDVEIKNVITWDVDPELSETSTNPVENRVITKKLNAISSDSTPDSELSMESEHCIQNRVVTQALQNKKDSDLDESVDTASILKLFS